jgi:hypothetical protein
VVDGCSLAPVASGASVPFGPRGVGGSLHPPSALCLVQIGKKSGIRGDTDDWFPSHHPVTFDPAAGRSCDALF